MPPIQVLYSSTFMISIVYQILLILSVPNGPALARLAQRRQCRHLQAKPFDLLHIVMLNGRLQERIRLDQLLQILIALRSHFQHIKPPPGLLASPAMRFTASSLTLYGGMYFSELIARSFLFLSSNKVLPNEQSRLQSHLL